MNFQPTHPLDAPAWLRAGRPAFRPLAAAARWLWQRSRRSRSTWVDSRFWRCVWNLQRLAAATPRRQSTPRLVRFAGGLHMQLDLSRLTDVLALCYGPGENEVGWLCRELCPADGVVIDVGGNVGTTTLAFADHVRDGGHVHVFEPSTEMQSALRLNIALSHLDRTATVHGVGLSDQPGRARLQVAIAGNPGSAYATDVGDDAENTIELRTLDHELRDSHRVDFVKIDVEGLELRVLRGAAQTLLRHRPVVVCEINEDALQRANTSGQEVCAFLEQLGYQLRWSDRGVLRAYDPAEMTQRPLHNVIAVPPVAAAVRPTEHRQDRAA